MFNFHLQKWIPFNLLICKFYLFSNAFLKLGIGQSQWLHTGSNQDPEVINDRKHSSDSSLLNMIIHEWLIFNPSSLGNTVCLVACRIKLFEFFNIY